MHPSISNSSLYGYGISILIRSARIFLQPPASVAPSALKN
ncbi:hypothetical protein CLOLEP_00460 [[Clostridium] leptum DSM 753]|uniref:Uncharacterized protein n=1 Tax=[Clostridium] leptum DSM 753 TaxID=428125 RepID=A7VPI3_9FIRM|nr:hypothetical protein CLOLEP_00460 [[Clostridium] leptum DSM 753]